MCAASSAAASKGIPLQVNTAILIFGGREARFAVGA